MANWKTVSSERPCHSCGKSDWCSTSVDGAFAICRRADVGGGRAKLDKSGAEYWVYRLNQGPDEPRTTWSPRLVTSAAPRGLDPAQLDEMYRFLLKKLTLAPADAKALAARGLSPDYVRRAGYRSLPTRDRHPLAKALIERFGEDQARRLPGLYFKGVPGDGFWTIAGPSGLLIPVRTARAQIIALKIRRRADDAPKYLYLSSSRHGGLGPGAPAHVPMGGDPAPETVRLTEGELKADVASALSDVLTVSISGVANWRGVVDVMHDLACRTCRLSFDMDIHTNRVVANALKNAALHLITEGFQIELELWDPAFKGIDDCLANGIKPHVIRGGRAYAEIIKIYNQTAVEAAGA